MLRSTLDTDQLRTFIAIVETGSFARAAGDVNKTQSAVSMQMRRLEGTVGKALFRREGRSNKLTTNGERLLEFARRIIQLNEEAVGALAGPALKGHVRIGTPDDYADRFLPPVFARFSRSHPQVEVEVLCESSFDLCERVGQKDVDLAIVTHSDTGNKGEVIRRERLLWVSSPSHSAHNAEIVPLAVGPMTCSWRTQAVTALDSMKRLHRIAYSSPSATAVAAAVMSGLAISVLPESAVRPGMRLLNANDGYPPLPHCDIALLRAPGEHKPHVTALADHVIDSLTNLIPSPDAVPMAGLNRHAL